MAPAPLLFKTTSVTDSAAKNFPGAIFSSSSKVCILMKSLMGVFTGSFARSMNKCDKNGFCGEVLFSMLWLSYG